MEDAQKDLWIVTTAEPDSEFVGIFETEQEALEFRTAMTEKHPLYEGLYVTNVAYKPTGWTR